MKWENTLMAYEEDIKNRSFWEWMKAHTSFAKPLHRYEGVLELNNDELIFTGRDVKENKEFLIKIPLKDITDVYYGFDKVFRGRDERAWPWNKPLRIRYRYENGERTIYLFAHYHIKKGIRSSDNKEVYEKLKEIIME